MHGIIPLSSMADAGLNRMSSLDQCRKSSVALSHGNETSRTRGTRCVLVEGSGNWLRRVVNMLCITFPNYCAGIECLCEYDMLMLEITSVLLGSPSALMRGAIQASLRTFNHIAVSYP